MEALYSVTLPVNGQNIVYRVSFDQDQYKFIPDPENSNHPFSFIREHDEWHALEFIEPSLKEAALESLDKYLLAQH